MTVMTHSERKRRILNNALPIICVLLTTLMLLFGEDMKAGFIGGARLALLKILPTLFPFFILADLWSTVFEPSSSSKELHFFEKPFGVSNGALSAFIIGMVCGFPLGVRSAVKQYEYEGIGQKELEWLCPLVNNPSAAFVISGIGAGLYGSISVGVYLYLSVIFSAVLIGIFSRPSLKISEKTHVITRQSFNLTSSIRSAGMSSLAILSYIVFFSALIGLLRSFIKNELLLTVISCFLEISSACSMTAFQFGGTEPLSLAVCAFALGFSGFSVHLQAFSFMPSSLSKKRYLFTKLLIGILSTLIAFSFSFIVI